MFEHVNAWQADGQNLMIPSENGKLTTSTNNEFVTLSEISTS